MLGIGQLVLCIEGLLHVWAHVSSQSIDKISEEAKKNAAIILKTQVVCLMVKEEKNLPEKSFKIQNYFALD